MKIILIFYKSMTMQIQKRNGTFQALDLSKIVYRIDRLIQGIDEKGQSFGKHLSVDANMITLEVCQHIENGVNIKSSQLDEITAEICAEKLLINPDYNELAKRLVISNNHKNSRNYQSLKELTYLMNQHGRFSQKYIDLIEKYGEQLDQVIDFKNDYIYLDYFGFKTLEKSYLIRAKDSHGNVVIERPQHLYMRVALAIHQHDIERVIETYHHQAQFYYTHATPTLYNAGQQYEQLSSCFLAGVPDTIEGMYETVRRFALISKNAGGIGCWISDIRGKNASINSTGGKGSGIIAYIRTLNELAKHVDQGAKRKGAIALYLEPWHPDVFEFLDLKKNNGNEELRARDIFLALCVSDLFMKRVKQAIGNKGQTVYWSLMCPKESPGLTDCYGKQFEELYTNYENKGQYVRQIDILTLWNAILVAQMETSLPYMLYKDSMNEKSNQKNLGVIKCSNLCSEIIQFSSYDEYSSCNLASISLAKYVDKSKPYNYDLEKLADIATELTRNLNNIIDNGYCPVPQIKRSNFRHRPIGIGIQGLADVFFQLRYPYESQEAQELNILISEAIYYGAVRGSLVLSKERCQQMQLLNQLSKEQQDNLVESIGQLEIIQQNINDFEKHRDNSRLTKAEVKYYQTMKSEYESMLLEIQTSLKNIGFTDSNYYELQYWNNNRPSQLWGSYSSFDGSPTSKGLFQFDLWGRKPSGLFDWEYLRQETVKFGLRNSLLVALMPTASTAQIMGNNECFEPITDNIYTRQVLSGNFIIVNKYLQQDLIKMGLWNKQIKDQILLERGSVQHIESIPREMKNIYKTTWEISKKTYIKMASDRGTYVDQSQSLNLFIEEPNNDILTTVHLYGWELGLKTGMYYLRRKTVQKPQQFTIAPVSVGTLVNQHKYQQEEEGGCLACQA